MAPASLTPICGSTTRKIIKMTINTTITQMI